MYIYIYINYTSFYELYKYNTWIKNLGCGLLPGVVGNVSAHRGGGEKRGNREKGIASAEDETHIPFGPKGLKQFGTQEWESIFSEERAAFSNLGPTQEIL